MTAAIALGACGGGEKLPGGIRLAKDVEPEAASRLATDLRRLEGLRMNPGDADFQARFGVEGRSGSELLGWLSERVRVIVGAEIADERIRLGRDAEFPDTPLPRTESSRPEWGAHRACKAVAERPELWERIWGPEGDGHRPVTAMANFGAALYFVGKRMGTVLEARPPGLRWMPVDSPRAGLIEVGEGLFMHDAPDSAAASLWRVSVFFHEGRHSDGNGESLSFFHAVCPRGHALAGANACDRVRNGPYAVGAEIARHIAENCEQGGCGMDTAAREELRLEYLESFSRVIDREWEREDCRAYAQQIEQSGKIRDLERWFLGDEPAAASAESGVARCREFVAAVETEEKALDACPKTERRAPEVDAQPERAR